MNLEVEIPKENSELLEKDNYVPGAPKSKLVRGRVQRRLRRIMPIKIKNDMENFLSLYGKPSREGYNSAIRPFFSKYVSQEGIEKKDVQEVYRVLAKYDLPKKLEILFHLICNPHVEYYFNNWTLMSLDTLEKHFDKKVEDGQKRVLDFAHYYLGMGHCIVCSIDPEDQKIFFCSAGGCNDFDRVANFNKIIDYIPKDDDKYEFDYWLKLASSKSKTEIDNIKLV